MSHQAASEQLDQWPESLRSQISARFVPPLAITPLHGLSQASVWRVTFSRQRMIVKRTSH